MGHYWSEVRDEYEPDEKQTLEQSQKRTTMNDKHLGFTQVWEGKPSDFIGVIRTWSNIAETYLKIEQDQNTSNIALLVANEWIDWQWVRSKGEYQPANSNNTRLETKIFDDLRGIKPLNHSEEYRQG